MYPLKEQIIKIVPTLHVGAIYINQKNKDGKDEERVAGVLSGIDPDKPYIFDLKSKIIEGRMLSQNDTAKILIGKDLAGGYGASVFPDDLGSVRPGDKILVEFNGITREYTVVGIFKTKHFDTDRSAYILKSEMRSALGTSFSDASEVIIRLKKRGYAKPMLQYLKSSQLPNYKMYDWEQKLAFGAGISKSFEVIGQILRIIGAIVAGLVIFIVVFVDIINKRRQIGILKAIGIKNEVIILDYIIRGVVYTIIGIIFGYFLMQILISGFEKHPIDMPMADVVPFLRDKALILSVLFFGLAGFLGSVVPAYKEIRKEVLTLLYR